MQRHLTDPEMTQALGGEPGGETLAHLVGCPTCLAEWDRLRAVLTYLAEQARVQAERPVASWEGQRRRIAGRLGDRPSSSPRWRWAWAPAILLLVALGSFWFYGHTPRPSPGPEADHALLIAVERSVQAHVPLALRPAALLAAELEGHGTETGRKTGAETGDEL